MSLDELFLLSHEELFSQIKSLNQNNKIIKASPTFIDASCKANPPCNHCKWETFKATGKLSNGKNEIETALNNAKFLESKGINRTFLASGWMGYTLPRDYYEYIYRIKENTSLEVYGLFGALGNESLKELKSAGLDGYLCSLESPSEKVYRSFRPGGDSLKDRINALNYAKSIGLKLWSGFLFGLGEEESDIRYGLKVLKDLEVESLSILPFMPFPYTKMIDWDIPNPLKWAKTAAIGKLFMPNVKLFVDAEDGCYGEYAKLLSPDGVYTHPKR